MKRYLFAAVFFFVFVHLFAQPSSLSNNASHDGVYLIPQTIYVGDRGTLVLPLGAAYAEMEAIVITETNLLPLAADIVISRMEIEKRNGISRLLVDFQAYAPGMLELPLLIIGNYEFAGLNVHITSILEAEDDRVLSEAAPPMPVPGTLVLVYGSIISLVFFLLIVFVFAFRGVPYLRAVEKRRHRKHVLRVLRRSLYKMRNVIAKNGTSGNDDLAKVSHYFRNFLCFFTKCDCFTMVPKEFLQLPKMMHTQDTKGGEIYILEHVDALHRMFKHCDDLRFSGNTYSTESVLQVIDDINNFAAEFESCEKEFLKRGNPISVVPGAAS
ncbi:MAG: hypothetical protein LBV20_00725 [Treponema sp.]|jgi:hypothetical protein|nr:hypothetical protein [Treponema sp.]